MSSEDEDAVMVGVTHSPVVGMTFSPSPGSAVFP